MIYEKDFYDDQEDGSERSARKVVPLLVRLLRPRSILDVGCGVGPWPAAFAREGVDAYGLDGPWVDLNRFQLGADRFTSFDFGQAVLPFAPPVPLPRFDMVTTFEFLEHVDEARAEALVDFMTGLTDVVIAGAALPGQGGHHHVNEQWPDYWARKFVARGFEPFDFLRPMIWDWDVEPWYVQNTVGYFRNGPPAELVEAAEAAAVARLRNPAGMVHPGMFTRIAGQAPPSLKATLKREIKARFGLDRS